MSKNVQARLSNLFPRGGRTIEQAMQLALERQPWGATRVPIRMEAEIRLRYRGRTAI
jgi:hypothetical protein